MVKKSLNVFPSSQKWNHDNFFGVDHFDFAASGDHLSLGDTLPGTGSTRARALASTYTLLSSMLLLLSFSVCLLLLFVLFLFYFYVWIVYHKSVATLKSVHVICFFFLDDSLRTLQKLFVCLQKCLFCSSSVWICFTVLFHKTNRTLHKIRFSPRDDDALLKIKIQRKLTGNWRVSTFF